MTLKIYLETLGCSKNQVDSEVMLGILSKHNYEFTNNEYDADIIIVNTCGFIESAKQESIETILELSQLKEKGKCKALIVTGCLSQRYSKELFDELPEVNAFIGTNNFNEIAIVIENIFENKKRFISTKNINDSIDYDLPRVLTTPTHTAYLKIAEGCDNYCTYCIIPKIRGKYKSRPIENIVKEAKTLAAHGVKELIIIAQDITRYGKDLYGDYKLVELLEKLSNIDNIKWIRLQYSYPDIISDELIDLIASNKKICNYMDIPLQHCNNEILKKMNRKTSKEQIITLINKLREKVPNISIRTSLIVGFPGETEEQFQELLNFVEEIKFDKLGVFTYSLEENTPAAKLPNQISDEIKQQRLDSIMALQKNISHQKNMDKIGNIYDILIEEKVENENIYIGRTEFDAPEVDGIVYIHTDVELNIGEFTKSKIIDALEYDLIGEIINEFSKQADNS